jgi:hypothetical protein
MMTLLLLGGCIRQLLVATLFHSNCLVVFAFSRPPPSPRLIFTASKPGHQPGDTSSKLFGYTNVNDYLNSFGKDDGKNDASSNDNFSGSRGRGYKYIGHGRVTSSSKNNAAEGGVFDINHYFSSFGQSSSDDDDRNNNHDNVQYYDAHAIPDNVLVALLADANEADSTQQPQQSHLTHEQIIAKNNARLCPKSFLTQASIQSFIYLLEECRDPHSGKWIQDFLGLKNLLNYHGTAAFDVTKYPTWDSVLIDLMRQPNQRIIVSAKKRGRGHGGWSKNNPYLRERYVEFPIDIRPALLVQRLLSVREQLALEFQRDLEIVKIVDGMIFESYFSITRREREEKLQNTRAFDRISMEILSNFTEFSTNGIESSTFRVGNFDLLYSLCTQASVHRLLRELRDSKVDSVSFQWLQKFYSERVREYFDGDQPFGRADDFIDALLRSPPSLISMDDGRSLGLTDPLRISERIIAKRSEVSAEWIDLMREVKSDHLVLSGLLFRVMMGKAVDESGDFIDEMVVIEEERTWGPFGDDAGMFE